MDILDDVRKIHPVIGVAVLAFKAIVTLELKRRDNDQKVLVLQVKMQEMMEIFVQLRAIKPEQKEHEKGSTVEQSFKSLCDQIAKDMGSCANLCDSYSKKRRLVKLLKSPIYDSRLAGYIQIFIERRTELDSVLSMFTAQKIHSAFSLLENNQQVLNSIAASIQVIFAKLCTRSPLEKELWRLIKAGGGLEKCSSDESVLGELLKLDSQEIWAFEETNEPSPFGISMSFTPSALPRTPAPAAAYYSAPPPATRQFGSSAAYYSAPPPMPHHFGPTPLMHPNSKPIHVPSQSVKFYQGGSTYREPKSDPILIPLQFTRFSQGGAPDVDVKIPQHVISNLKEELAVNIDDDLKKNLQVFNRKFDEQQRLLQHIEETVIRQGSRVISAFREGPHDRIYDPELRAIWKEMGWKLSVPVEEFVHTVHDYYVAQYSDSSIVSDHFRSPPLPDSTLEDQIVALREAFSAAKQRAAERWALKHINMANIVPLKETFDGDASGFVTVWEANQVTSLCPKDWSFLHWLAYWAAGRHFTVWQYQQKIGAIINQMHNCLETLLPTNRAVVDQYLAIPDFYTVDQVLQQIFPCMDQPEGVFAEKIATYARAEEEIMEQTLKALNYEIDGLDTLEFIIGESQIERCSKQAPVLYLIARS
ncbi:hypothetical protein BT96DRAFT_702221 [Gymnopus androsaceus JB14]|uniref:Uncharacterized protein n=1 Tax=Gymnopus androsaceus JB14 TaxID=1447944 RepID=A0A6A4HQD9_9AGAR|nr:hypothetical protein BT96DRAFT_702221 [Gymnopus androsaceus JB14]